MMVKSANKAIAIAQLTLKLFPQEWKLGATCEHYFLELPVLHFEPVLQENPRYSVYLCMRVFTGF